MIGGTPHWSSGVAAAMAGGNHRRARARLVALANLVSAPSHVRIQDWHGTHFLASGPTGRTELAAGFSELWTIVDALAGKPIDPLSPELLSLLDG